MRVPLNGWDSVLHFHMKLKQGKWRFETHSGSIMFEFIAMTGEKYSA